MPFQVVMFSYAYCYYISLHIQYVCLDTHAHSSSHMQTIQKRSAFCWRLMDVTWSGVLSHNTSLLRLLRGRSPDNASSISCVLERRIVPFIESSIVQFHTGIRIYSVVILANRCICVLQYYSAQNDGNFTVDGVTPGQVEKVMWSSASVFLCVCILEVFMTDDDDDICAQVWETVAEICMMITLNERKLFARSCVFRHKSWSAISLW